MPPGPRVLPANVEFASSPPYTASFFPGPGQGEGSPRMMPLGAAGGCQISRTDVVLTSGNRMPMGGPGTGGDRGEAGNRAAAVGP